ncbi:cytochrome C oxidase copper chaperone-domain-containing protein [Sparassis latifolia]|uniref:Cytochrome c oxidase copper chaperone n=1 Tax=Sparassis crispa TaxID=139825 RepID=A0A401GKV9_9APHY|nr:Cytochrome c oxidase copper chaperone [Sparassis crispa]GBE82779.1 Cytochrome c oxidase copper chaperone [Sparassis crispa]
MFDFLGSWWGTSAPAVETKAYDPTDPKMNPLNPEGLKPCCACPQTKSARDACFLKFDSSDADDNCKDLVQQHLACMRGYGFKV